MTGQADLDPVELAVADNTRWCDAMCRAHGLRTDRTPELWTCLDLPPRFHPAAITLGRGPAVEAALRGFLAARGGAVAGGVKDAFCEIDLDDLGFDELFRASWLWRMPADPGPTSLTWRRATAPAGLAAWETAWEGGAAPATPRGFPDALLADDGLAFLSGWRGDAIAVVAALSLTGPVVGVSNVVGADTGSDDGWADLPAVAARCFPGRSLVGYERDADLEKARRHGFTETGPLRVWVPRAG